MNKRPEAIVFNELKDLVASRVYPGVFTQKSTTPVWPAIRYIRIATSPPVDIKGDGGDDVADVLMQIDVVAASWAAMVALRAQVKEKLADVNEVPAILDGEFETFDQETRTYRAQMTYWFYPSSSETGTET